MRRVSAALYIVGLFLTGCGGTTTTDSASTAAESASSVITTPSAAPSPPVTPASPIGPASPITESALDGLLLTPTEVDSATGATGMTVAATSNALATDIQVAADAPPEKIACVGIAGTAEAQAYAGAGSTAVRDQVLQAPGDNGASRTAAQSVILFESAQEASAFVAESAEKWPSCKEFRGSSASSTVGPVATKDGVVSTVITTTDGNGATVDCQRALTAANNVVVEASACGAATADAALTIAGRIAATIAEQ